MNFTREPIIETVITPREGCKLVVRSSKGVSQEDYFVDAVEVVSFGHSFFFRSQERPKSFLVPVSDYEILELKETRMVLKNISADRSIKIGGGREAPPRREEELGATESRSAAQQQEQPRKREKRRRGRRGRDRERPRETPPQGGATEASSQPPEEFRSPEGTLSEAVPTVEKAPSFISKLFPPPPTLIKESLTRYKPAEEEGEAPAFDQGKTPSFDETIFEHPTAPENRPEDEDEE